MRVRKLKELKELKESNLISEQQFTQIEPIITHQVVSVFYELRTMLYLGVMLFTTGVGFLIYQNIGQLGHILAIIALSILSVGCLIYCFWKGRPYSKDKVESPNPYFDYVLLLGCLLFISVFGYLEFQFGFLERSARAVSLITALLFFFFAYRFDHLGILSIAITALASFFGIVISWNDLNALDQLYNVGLVLSIVIAVSAIVIERIGIKKHFTFTYLNFCALAYFISAFAGIADNDRGTYLTYALALYVGVGLTIWVANWKKSFLFLLYGVVAAYIGTTYFLADNTNMDIEPWLLYLLVSAGGFVYFIVKYRHYFKRTK